MKGAESFLEEDAEKMIFQFIRMCSERLNGSKHQPAGELKGLNNR